MASLVRQRTMHWIASPLGRMLVVLGNGALQGLYFEGQKYFPELDDSLVQWDASQADPSSLSVSIEQQVEEYFLGGRQRFDLPIDLIGTPFQRDVWNQLTEIPYGEKRTYGQIARSIGKPEASRAVGAAIGRNPISVIVPCHRVVGQDASLVGYAGGLDRKSDLLQLELRTCRLVCV